MGLPRGYPLGITDDLIYYIQFYNYLHNEQHLNIRLKKLKNEKNYSIVCYKNQTLKNIKDCLVLQS